MTLSNRHWLAVAGIAGLGLLGLLVGLIYPRWADYSNPDSATAVKLSGDPGCDAARQPCSARQGDLSLTLRLNGPLRPLQPFPVEVQLTGPLAATVRQVTVDFSMVGMEMGLNRFHLQRQPDGRWSGQALLPVCSSGRHDWRATVQVGGAERYAVEFGLRVGENR